MGKMIIKTIVATFIIFVITYYSYKGVASWQQGYSWTEMDWNERGRTTIADFFAASDIGKREIQLNGVLCAEYYSYKDGLTIKLICPK